MARATLDVVTYNVEGVPGRRGRQAELARIGRRLRELRASGDAPDVVLFQEVFSRPAKRAVRSTAYPELVTGPSRKDRRDLPRRGNRPGREWRKGELGIRFVGSGLVIASTYPVSAQAAQPFSRRACAGFDCLSNKGSLHARIRIPGVPAEVELFNTHMNAQRASGVRARRHLPVHQAQALELAEFIEHVRDPANPIILGGDFNMRASEDRFTFFRTTQPLQLVHEHCLPQGACDVRLSWDGDAPWMDTQDLQLFASGGRVQVRPVRVEALFDGRPGSPKLSDHDALRVVYELTWDLP
jgi:endonuclease/exonuclease/phosphatase family metal-dependent hydrolase